MKANNESTFALIVRSEERSRNVLEIVLYACFALSAIASIWQFAAQPVDLHAAGLAPVENVVAVAANDCLLARN